MPVAKYHITMVMGSATIYRIRLVKLKSKNTLPTKPQTKDAALSPIHLSALVSATLFEANSAHQRGSG